MKIVSIAISKKKGTVKKTVPEAELQQETGLAGDAHAGAWHRQVSFLAKESIEKMRADGFDVAFGDFAENIATEGIDWPSIPVGTRVRLGDRAVVEITQIGKECHKKCAIYYRAGECVMPKEGVFGRVLRGGIVKVGDPVQVKIPNDAARDISE